MKNESMTIKEVSPEAAELFIKKANKILSSYEGNTNLLKRHLLSSLALASENDGRFHKEFEELVQAHKIINELVDALDPLLEKNENALDGAEYKVKHSLSGSKYLQ